MMDNWKDNYLKEEYFKLQDQYEDYDRRALQIEGWVGAESLAGLALGIDSDTSANGLTRLVIASISLCFWYLESMWKLFQYAIGDRIRIIEAHFRKDEDVIVKDPEPLQIYNWWFHSYSRDEAIYPYEQDYRPQSKCRRLWNAGNQSFVHLPYSLIIFICGVLFILQKFEYLKPYLREVYDRTYRV